MARTFFDRALRTVTEYQEKVEYIHVSPAEARLVSHAEDSLWSSGIITRELSDRPAITVALLAIERFLLPAEEGARM